MSTGQDSALFPCPQETTLTPQARALHNNFRLAMGGLRRELVRSIFFLRLIADSKVYRRLGYATIKEYAAREGGLTGNPCRGNPCRSSRCQLRPHIPALDLTGPGRMGEGRF